jgi:hypothetical protein
MNIIKSLKKINAQMEAISKRMADARVQEEKKRKGIVIYFGRI